MKNKIDVSAPYRFVVLTLFPEFFDGFMQTSLVARALKKEIIAIQLVNLRDFGLGRRRQVDDTPYGGGPGMLLRVDVVGRAIESIKGDYPDIYTILLDPKGERFTQKFAVKFSQMKSGLLLICGRYEGYDERIRQLVDLELSLGDFILNGGETAASAVIEATSRLLSGFIQKKSALRDESFNDADYLEAPQYTRPVDYRGQRVPDVLLSGDHRKIAHWRKQQAGLD